MKRDRKREKRARLRDHIPYEYCYEEAGMIETEQGVFTRCYQVMPPEQIEKGGYNSKLVKMLMEDVLKRLSESFSFQFTVRNSHQNRDDYLKSIQIEEGGGDGYQEFRRMYNSMLRENCSIGHNNFVRSVYLTISMEADTADEEFRAFEEADAWIREAFQRLYGFSAKPMLLEERLALLYEIYHPGPEEPDFGSRVDYDGMGFSFDSMRSMKMSTKDVVAPEIYDCSARDYLKVGSSYVRVFFINSMPSLFSENMLLDLASVSSRMVLSAGYEAMDCVLGYEAAARLVRANTRVREVPVRDTIKDRKEQRTLRQELLVRENEESYFNRTVFEQFKEARAKEQPVLQVRFVIALYADSMEELERDSALLRISASKYACQIRCCDYQQDAAFQTALPLNYPKIHVDRAFRLKEAALMQPLCIRSAFEGRRTFQGMNAVNDNLILLDRSNCLTALIAGAARSGKTMAVKREAANILLCTQDEVAILAEHPAEYGSFCRKLRGQVVTGFTPDIFAKDDNYNLDGEKSTLRRSFLEGFLVSKAECNGQMWRGEGDAVSEKAAEEAGLLSRFESVREALQAAGEGKVGLRMFLSCMDAYSLGEDRLTGERRLSVLGFADGTELLVNLDYLWNYAVAGKKQNRNVWIFVDAVDALLHNAAVSQHLVRILERAEILGVPFVFVAGDAACLVADAGTAGRLGNLTDRMQYFRLLSLGPIERQWFVERLDIPDQLLPYLVERQSGEGVLAVPSSNIAVNDHFDSRDHAFYELFE